VNKMPPPGSGFIDRFVTKTSLYPDQIAIEEPENFIRITYAQLLSSIQQMKSILNELGVGKGKKILVLLTRPKDFITSLYAISAGSGIMVPVSPHLTKYEMESIVDDCHPDGIILTSSLFHFHETVFKKEKKIQFVITIDKKIDVEPLKNIFFDDFKGKKSPVKDPLENPEVTCHYTFRGFGYPLGTIHRYHDYTWNQNGIEKRNPYEQGDSFLSFLPLYHIYAIVIIIIFPLCQGCKIIFIHKMLRLDFIEIFKKFHIRLACFIPVFIPKLIRDAKANGKPENFNLHPGFSLSSSASYLDPHTIKELTDAVGVEINQAYGSTETLAVSSAYKKKERGTLGLPFDHTTIRVVDFRGSDVPQGQIGEIITWGPATAERYLNCQEANARHFKNGFFYTGDLGYFDSNGFLNFIGRKLPIAKIKDQMVDLIEIDNILSSHPSVIRAVTVLKKGDKTIKKTLFTHLIVDNPEITPGQIKRFCANSLSRYKIPLRFNITNYNQALIKKENYYHGVN